MTDPQVIREAVEGHLLREPGSSFVPITEALVGELPAKIGPVQIELTPINNGLFELNITTLDLEGCKALIESRADREGTP